MKFFNKSIAIYLSICVIIMCILSPVINVKAAEGDDVFQHGIQGYYMIDSSSVVTGDYFYYKYAEGKCWYCTFSDAIALVSNKSYGLTMSLSVLGALATGLMDYTVLGIAGGSSGMSSYQVWKGTEFTGTPAGLALNDISGCQIVSPNSNSDVSVDSTVNNYIYVYVKDYIDDLPLDYIIYQPLNISLVQGASGTTNQALNNSFKSLGTAFSAQLTQQNSDGVPYGVATSGVNSCTGYSIGDDCSLYATNTNQFDNVVTMFGLNESRRTFTGEQFLATFQSQTLQCIAIGKSVANCIHSTSYNVNNGTLEQVATSDGTSIKILQNKGCLASNIDKFTIYRNSTVATQIISNNYAPSYTYDSNTYNNYDSTSNNNTVNTNTNQINNSTTTNSNIYNQSTSNYREGDYYDNTSNVTNIDQSVINTTTQTIINNYYGDDSGGDDNGGGGGGGDDDSPIWEALLQAIVSFFRKIGELIAAILTGILGLLTEVLDAIAEITTNFTGVTDFLGQVFDFLPSEIVSVLLLGATLGILISLIKMLGK